ncbi:class I SAM-dependent methyltransferase [Pseudonocardia sp.]|uniref:class I SAM-dependent methyltransferase n=1 Tax=Pseudonocardia sp. TaxID=60912 RepID=UPI003D106301
MSAADRDRWDARYATTAPVEASVPLPPDLLAGREELLPASGRALDVACGCGATAVWLALRGLAVDAVDGSPVAIAAGAALARRPGPQADGGPGGGGGAAGRVGSDGTDSGTDSSTHGGADDGAAGGVRWRVHDLDQGLPPGWTGPYDVVVCQRFRDPALYPLLRAAVAPDGLLALTVLSVVGGRAGPYRAEPGELPAAFPGWRVIDQREGGGEAHLLARPPRSA